MLRLLEMVKKNGFYTGQVTDQGKTGDGIIQTNTLPVYIPNCIPGDEIEYHVLKTEKRRAYAKIKRVITASENRVEPTCNVADRCGGCQLQHQSYDTQSHFKSTLLKSRLSRFFSAPKLLPMIQSDHPWAFRNKMQFSFAQGPTGLLIGLYAPRSHRVIDTPHCPIMPEPMNTVLTTLRQWHKTDPLSVFDEATGTGILRSLMIRYSQATKQLMVIISTGEPFDHRQLLAALKKCPQLTSVYLSSQDDPKNDAVLGDELAHIWGKPAIEDSVFGIQCSVSPKSFMQANATLVDTLYKTVIDQINWQGKGTLVDLYCGTGILTCALAKKGGQVIGVDNNESAIADAKKNAQNNGCNSEFYCDHAEQFLTKNPDIDIVILDPPRQGCHADVLTALCQSRPKTIGYISCYPDTLGRDIKTLLDAGYVLNSLQPVDMFCHSVHIECVALLSVSEKGEKGAAA